MGPTTPLLRRIALLLSLAAAAAVPASGAVTVERQEGHFVFTAAWPEKSAAGKKSRTIVPLDSRLGDTSGLIGSLFITVDWWTLFGEPVENYIVEWTASGRFQVKDSTGATVTVTREEVARYPDLKLRFAQLKPKAMDFTVWYRLDYSGVLSAAERTTLDRRYRDLRRSGETLYDAERFVKNNQFLIAGSGVTPLSVPGSHSWQDFISSSVSTSYDVARSIAHQKPLIAETLKRARSLEIMNVRVVRLELPESEMRTIADKLRRYREGQADPTPLEQVAAAQKQEVSAYTAKDEWAEAAAKPAPAEPPVPRRAPDRLTYYYHPDGQKAFPKGYDEAGPFSAAPFPVAKVKVGTTQRGASIYNYIDERGTQILPFDSEHWFHFFEGVFSIRNAARPDAINRAGLYDAVNRTYLLPTSYNWVNRGELNKQGQWTVTTRKVVSFSSSTYTKRIRESDYKVQDVVTEHGVYLWDSKNRTLVRQSVETKSWAAVANSFKGPLN